MDLGALEIFVEVARRLSFSAVGRLRQMEPSSVSRTIATIEGELGERLFHRTTRSLTLTEAGSMFLTRVEPLVLQFEDAREEVKAIGRGPVGTVKISASVAFGQTRLVPLLGTFQDRFPDLKIELLFSDTNIDLVHEGIDIAVRLAPSVDANVIVSKLIDTRYHVVASPAWLAANPLSAPDDLRRYSVLRFTLPGYRDRWLFRNAAGDVIAIPVSGNILISNALGLRNAALAGLGPALLADWLIASDLRDASLVDCFPSMRVTATEFETGAWLIYPSRDFLPNKVRVTIDFLREHLSGSRGGRSGASGKIVERAMQRGVQES